MFRTLTSFTIVAATLLAGCAAPAADKGTGPALWKIEDADSTIWLFGTVHLLPNDLVWRTPEMNAAFEAAAKVVLEVDTDSEAAKARMGPLITQYGQISAGQPSLSQSLGPADAALVARHAGKLGVPMSSLEQTRPWLASLALAVAWFQKEGLDPNAGVEQVLVREAKSKSKSIAYLESAEEQIRFLATLPDDVQRKSLVLGIRQIEETPDYIRKLDDNWVKGDDAALGKLLNDMMKNDTPEVYDALLTRRNVRWVSWIQTELAGSGETFVAVGAGHLAGDDSVIRLLDKAGTKVTRVAVSPPKR
jgi:uncharacterized protein